MTTGPQVSVVIAAYNAERFLARAVRSALGQSYANIEVCAIDDGSSDGTPRLLAELAAGDRRLSWWRQPNGGQARAKNEGIRRTRAPLVAFLDADDFWAPDKLEKQIPLFGRPEVGVVYSDLACVDERDELFSVPRATYYRGRVTQPLFLYNFVPFGSAVVRRSCLEAAGGFDESLSMGIDWALWLRVSIEHEFDFCDEPLLYYRSWSGQMSRNFKGRYDGAMRIMKDFVASHPGLIDRSTRRTGWASTAVSLAQNLADSSRKAAAAACLGRALVRSPLHWQAWLELVRLPLR